MTDFLKHAKALRLEGEYAQAIAKLTSSERLNFPVLLELGRCYFEMGEKEEARVYLEKCQNISPEHPLVLKLLISLYDETNNQQDLNRICEDALEVDPTNKTALAALEALKTASNDRDIVQNFQSENDFGEAATEARYEEELITPTLANMYEKQGHLKNAYHAYSSLLKKNPDNTALRHKVATLGHQLGISPSKPSAGVPNLKIQRLEKLLQSVHLRKRESFGF